MLKNLYEVSLYSVEGSKTRPVTQLVWFCYLEDHGLSSERFLQFQKKKKVGESHVFNHQGGGAVDTPFGKGVIC